MLRPRHYFLIATIIFPNRHTFYCYALNINNVEALKLLFTLCPLTTILAFFNLI